MTRKVGLLLLAGAMTVWAQSPGDRELSRALAGVEELRRQVDAGVAPRIKLEQAEEALADARDADLLSRTLYGDLTEEQSSEMEAAAARRVERRKASLGKTQQMVDVGALAPVSLEQPKQELEWAQKEYELVAERAALVSELAGMARAEQQAAEAREAEEPGPSPVMERFDGGGFFTRDDFKHVVLAFEKRFGKSLPVSAQGETALHRSLGFDHRDRVDVALLPDSQEGAWLRKYLESSDIPYYAFRSAIAGKATAAHIHIGPPSNRLLKAD